MFSQTGVRCTKEASSESQEANRRVWQAIQIQENLVGQEYLRVTPTCTYPNSAHIQIYSRGQNFGVNFTQN